MLAKDAWVFQSIGVGTGLAGPVLAGPLFQRFNEIYYRHIYKLYVCAKRAYYSRATPKVVPTPLQSKPCAGFLYERFRQGVVLPFL